MNTKKTRIVTIFPKDSEALFREDSKRAYGGADIQMLLLSQSLGMQEDIQVFSFIVDFGSENLNTHGLRLVPTYRETDGILRKFYLYHRKIREVKPHIIIQRGLTLFSCLLSLYCRIFGIKFVFMFAHDIESLGIYQSSRKKCPVFFLLRACAHLLIAQNQFEYDNVRKKVPEDRIFILKKGLDFSRPLPTNRKKYDAAWIARCEDWKRPELFLDLAERNPSLSFLMVCWGAREKEEYFAYIKSRAGALKNVTWLGFIDNQAIYSLLSQSRVFIITSQMEGDWPMTVLEAAMVGVPVLSLHLNYSNMLADYKAGYFCKDDSAFMQASLLKMVRDKKLYKELSAGIYRYVSDNHDMHRNVATLLNHIL